MRNNAVTYQAPVVSLADAPAILRDVAALCYHESDQREQAAKKEGPRNRYGLTDFHQEMARKHNANGDFPLALASSLEQLQPVTNGCSNRATAPEGYALVPWEVAANAVKVCEMHVNLARNVVQLDVTPLVKETKAALSTALNNSTPERRE